MAPARSTTRGLRWWWKSTLQLAFAILIATWLASLWWWVNRELNYPPLNYQKLGWGPISYDIQVNGGAESADWGIGRTTWGPGVLWFQFRSHHDTGDYLEIPLLVPAAVFGLFASLVRSRTAPTTKAAFARELCRTSRARRLAKWSWTLAFAAATSIWVASYWWCAVRELSYSPMSCLFVGFGSVQGTSQTGGAGPNVPWQVHRRLVGENVWWFEFRSHRYLGDCVAIPLWAPWLVMAVPSGLFWWRHWRRAGPGQCRACRYDLAGNVTGICPECGTKAEVRA
jgi:hypothetical protein